jgi:hypothetical protein
VGVDRPQTPRSRDRDALAPVADEAGPQAASEGNEASNHAALMAQAEWARSLQPTLPIGELGKHTTHIKSVLGDWAPRVRPYLGDVRDTVASRLSPDAPLAVGKELKALCHCPFRAFGVAILAVGDDADESLEHAVTVALGEASGSTRWRAQPEQVDRVRRDLQLEIGDRLVLAAARWGAVLPTPTQLVAQESELARWRRHLRRYVVERVESLDPAMVAARAKDFADRTIGRTSVFRDAVSRFHWPAQRSQRHAATWFRRAAASKEDPFSEDAFRNLVSDVRQTLVYASTEPAFLRQLDEVRQAYRELTSYARNLYGPILDVRCRWSFGGSPPTDAVQIRLGGVPVSVRGTVDRLRMVGKANSVIVEVTEFDTWAPRHRWQVEEDVRSGLRPELILTSLAVREVLAGGEEFAASVNAPVELAYDFARSLEHGQMELSFDQKSTSLQRVAASIGELVAEARVGSFPLVPNAAACPHLNPNLPRKACPIVDSCRFVGEPMARDEDPSGQGAPTPP